MKKRRVKNKAVSDFLRSREGQVRILRPLVDGRQPFGYECINPYTNNRCFFINKRSSLNEIVSVGELVVNMSMKQNVPIILGLEGNYYRLQGKDIVDSRPFRNNHKGRWMLNFSLRKARAWDVTTIGKFEPLVKDEGQLEIGESGDK